MSIVQITPTYSVSGELSEADFQTLATRGVDTLVNVRPDGEVTEQVNNAQWQDLAQLHHMKYYFIPVKPSVYSEQDIEQFAAVLKQAKAGVHGFCRTGTRAIHLWALANKGVHKFEYMQRLAKQAGYSLDIIATRFVD